MKETFVLQEEDLRGLAEKVVALLERLGEERDRASVLLLEGDLGAGKTTFTKTLASVLGVDEGEVHSPTFILKKEYRTTNPRFRHLVHIDAYRFNTPEEARVLRIDEDTAKPDALVVIEWPSKMTYVRPDAVLTFGVEDERTREITLEYEERN